MINGHALSPRLSFVAAITCRPEPRSRWSACSEARTNNLDGRRSSDEATASRNVAERRSTAAPDPPIWTPLRQFGAGDLRAQIRSFWRVSACLRKAEVEQDGEG